MHPRRYYCEEGASTPTQHVCGNTSVYCPRGSAAPVLAEAGDVTIGPSPQLRNATLPCPSGSYCMDGVQQPCVGGRFGCATHLSSVECSGACTKGFYCPMGSVSSQA
jgi:hypothetical protein